MKKMKKTTISKTFEDTVRFVILDDFKKRLKTLKKEYESVQRQLKDLCDELDSECLNESFINEIIAHMSVHLSELDVIERKIKEISQIIDNIRTEISN